MAMRDYSPAPGHAAGKRPAPLDRHAAARPQRQAMRIGDAERDSAASELGDHFAAGRLTLDELHDRIDLVLAARTRGQLGRVMGDLPSARREPCPPAAPAPGQPPRGDGQRLATSGGSYDGRLAAVGLLLLAMLIWLFTAVMFTRHGYYYHPYPHHPWSHP